MRVRASPVLLACVVALVAAGCGDGPAGLGKFDPSAPDDGVVIWAVGDGGERDDDDRRVARMIAGDDPERVIYLGDVYDTGTPEEFEEFAEVYGSLVERMWPTPGNHEWANHATGYDPFWRSVLGRPLPHRYERRAGGWTVLSVNSETPDDPEQLRWLRSRAGGVGTCRIAFWHSPRFNAGKHRDEEIEVAGLWDAVAGRAAIVLSGHDHDLQRFRPVDGTAQYIAGAGGRGHHNVNEDDPRLAFSDDVTHGALRITLAPGSADLSFIAADGTILDRSTVACRG
jgi:acid phosphatase type 7